MGQRLGQTRFGVYTDAILLQAARSVFLLPWVQNLRRLTICHDGVYCLLMFYCVPLPIGVVSLLETAYSPMALFVTTYCLSGHNMQY